MVPDHDAADASGGEDEDDVDGKVDVVVLVQAVDVRRRRQSGFNALYSFLPGLGNTSWGKNHKYFYSSKLTNRSNKLECLFLTSLSSLL